VPSKPPEWKLVPYVVAHCERRPMWIIRRNGVRVAQEIITPFFRLPDGTVVRGHRISAATAALLEGKKR